MPRNRMYRLQTLRTYRIGPQTRLGSFQHESQVDRQVADAGGQTGGQSRLGKERRGVVGEDLEGAAGNIVAVL